MANQYERERLVAMAEELDKRTEPDSLAGIVRRFLSGIAGAALGATVAAVWLTLGDTAISGVGARGLIACVVVGGILGLVADRRRDQRGTATAQSWLCLATIEENTRRIAEALEAQNRAGSPPAEE